MAADFWFGIIALCLTMYVLLDGYDLGIGILLLGEPNRERRRSMIEIVATAWDGNESWIVLLGVSLWGGLPAAYGAMLPALYLPLVIMLFSLIFRGVAIEMVSSSPRTPAVWSFAFGAGSLVAAVAQGFVIGGLLNGVRVERQVFAGGTFDFFAPFSVFTAISTVLVYAVAGAAYLQHKSEGATEHRAAASGRVLLVFAVPFVLITALWTGATAAPLQLHPTARGIAFWLLVVVAVVAAGAAWIGFARGPDSLAFRGVVTAEIAGLVALFVGIAPLVVPPDVTIDSAAAPSGALTFLLIGVGINIPLVFFYNWYAHHVFRGKYRLPAEHRPSGMTPVGAAIRPTKGGDRR
ncbi:cytochrome d ubiquinol oxidase subunit II [Flexivirga meconopsidis]|uniref:cytochrome d ubiquinol oxidase subunit II n=1 Tax=Flexivirga meconopsidis TaxID=2977121 RepID=UPI002240BE59|nr:cytochrome d ubiquinol oxidase subunit II [Flexivirga meconopsidis]